jgi:hypothetical protein
MRYLLLQIAQTIPQDIQDRADEIVEQVKANPTLL